jgi:methyl-accepting chemotaxis protein
MARSIAGVAVNAERITDVAGEAATSVAQLDRSIRGIADLARQADESTRRIAGEAQEGGGGRKKIN